MFSPGHEQTGLIIDYCLGRCCPAEAQKVEALIAHSDRAADWHSQVQAALAFLSYLPAEPCPDYLADLTVQRLRRLAAQRPSAEGPRSRLIRVDPRGWFTPKVAITAIAASIVVFASILIISLGSTTPHPPLQVPPEQLAKDSGTADLRDSNYAWLPILDGLQAVGFAPELPGKFPGTSGSAGYYPRWVDHSIELGPRALPISWGHHVRQSCRDHLTRSLRPVLSGE